MIEVSEILSSSLFGVTAEQVTGAWPSIIVGAVAVGVLQPFSRIVFTYILKKKVNDTKMAYKKRKTRKKKEDPKKKRKTYRRKKK